MGRAQVHNLPPGMPSNPYHTMKERLPLKTLCETCNRTINTRDWPIHKNSKGHRANEQHQKDKENGKVTKDSSTAFGFDTSGDGGFEIAPTGSFSNDSYGKQAGGSGACFGCGEVGHNKRDCPSSAGGYGGGGSGDRACFGCGEIGHTKRDCPKGGGSACYGCGEPGHTKRDCPNAASGGGQACFNCGMEGHRKMDCPEPLKPRAGGGGGRACFNCLQTGHNASDCPEPKVDRCRNCDAEGHVSRDCPKPKDWSRVKCKNCSKFGHGEKRCPEPAGGSGGESGGGWETSADSGAATGGWGEPDPSSSGAPSGGWGEEDAGAGTSSNWADQTSAEAQW
ncbi:hypothetical protein E8E13_008099 [Curvularia kusanoi]|uniref:CCHC-type domain-containing protein n=1 Tax=Curvularia kusanoi TaxID=90978 RepID=A0A9P4WC44_CURKU|nr:hypothetical protein E8E13_008099 [Curvularia kusanoi]